MQDRHSVRFLLNEEPRVLKNISPTMTVLEYLRGVERMTGTKEGCAEGDCGACTVVVAHDVEGKLQYQACNACIMFVPFLHGRQLITVEHLSSSEGELHPVQQAMVDQHGSQCGFCTPGFVMSMFAMYHNGCDTSRPAIDDALAGNLCRCTGYAPIVRAVRQALSESYSDQFEKNEKKTLAKLSDIEASSSIILESDKQKFYAPATIQELVQILKDNPASRIVAGATDVGLWVTKERRHLDCVVSVSSVKELQEITVDVDGIKIGAAASVSAAMGTLSQHYPSLDQLFRRYGSVQIRNLATIGGNVANGSPIGDSLPALIALSATLIITSASGSRSLPVEDFFIDYGKQDLKPGEFLERIKLPRPVPGQEFKIYKIAKRFHQDISAVCGAFSIILKDGIVQSARICFGGMAAIPQRAIRCEQALIGSSVTSVAIDDVKLTLRKDFSPITDFRGTSQYRELVSANLLEKMIMEISGHSDINVWDVSKVWDVRSV